MLCRRAAPARTLLSVASRQVRRGCSTVQQPKNTVTRETTYAAFSNVIKPFILNFEDTKTSFKKKSSVDLMQSLIILRACTMEPLVKFAPTMIQASLYARLDDLVFWVIKKTFFGHFCAGESLDQVEPVISKLHDANVGSILDYSAEGAVGSEADLDVAMDRIMETIKLAQTYDSIGFSCLKVSNVGMWGHTHSHRLAAEEPYGSVLAGQCPMAGHALWSWQVSALCSARLLERVSVALEEAGGFQHIDQVHLGLGFILHQTT